MVIFNELLSPELINIENRGAFFFETQKLKTGI